MGRQSTVGILRDLLSQFAKLSEEADVVDSDQHVSQVSQQLSELHDRLAARRATVEVSSSHVDFVALLFVTAPDSRATCIMFPDLIVYLVILPLMSHLSVVSK